MIPTSIDGTDITGATIDGTDVQEITVDGQTVFTAGPTLPVAYSDLVAWYPFDSAEYSGSNGDDVTAILGGSGNDTAFDASVNGATYQSSGGVTDINAGANSGAFDFDGSDDITINSLPDWNTMTLWINPDTTIDGASYYGGFDLPDGTIFTGKASSSVSGERILITVNADRTAWGGTFSSGEWYHWVFVFDGSGWDFYVDGVVQSIVDTVGGGASASFGSGTNTLMRASGVTIDAQLDDVRFYDRPLTDTEIGDIVSNTPHP